MKKTPFTELKSLFVKHGFSNAEVAKMAGMSQSTMSNRMTSKSAFTPYEIYTISAIVGIHEEQYANYFIKPYLAFRGINKP